MKVYLDFVHNLHQDRLNMGSVWVIMPEYYSRTKIPPWASDVAAVPDAIRVVGPVEITLACQIHENLSKAFRMAGVEVVADETDGD
jgi:hypothetical protein